jgi:hypothetical protein
MIIRTALILDHEIMKPVVHFLECGCSLEPEITGSMIVCELLLARADNDY